MKIVVSRDNETLQEVDLGEEAKASDESQGMSFYIGRSDDCHIVLDDPKVSREHAELNFKKQVWSVKKKTGFGQLLINGTGYDEKILAPGDMLSLGPYLLNFFPSQVEAQAQAESEPENDETEVADFAPQAQDGVTQTVMENDVLEGDDEEEFPEEKASDDELPELDGQADNVEDNDESSGFVSDGAESVDFSAENDDTAFPEDNDDVDSFEGADNFDMESGLDTDMVGDDDFDESTKVIQSFAKTQLELFGEYAPYDKFNIDQPEVLIGRDSEKCHIVLNDPEVSSVHASIKKNNIVCTLEDMQSGNGTLLNGERVNKNALTNGDEFIIGSTTFTVKIISDFIKEESERLMPVDDNQVMEVEEVVEVGADFDDDGDAQEALEGGASFGDKVPQGKQSLVEKFRSLPPKKQAIYAAMGVLLLFLFLGDGSEKSKTADNEKDQNKKEEVAEESGENESEKTLDPETLELVESSYQLANNYIQKGMYDEALQELDRNIFRYTEDYKNAGQLKEIAIAGIEQRERIEEERRKEIQEAERRRKVKELVERATKAVEERKVTLAEDLFSQITKLDPENFDLSALKIDLNAWKKEQEKKALAKAQKEAERKRMREALKPGKNFYIRKDWHSAIIRLTQFVQRDDVDDDLIEEATQMLEESKEKLNEVVGPLLGRARSLREGQDLKGAYEHYGEVLDYQPTNAEAMNEMNEIRETLKMRSRKVYREAIIAESLSLLEDAKEKYQEVQQISPTDSEYYMKATDKLKQYTE